EALDFSCRPLREPLDAADEFLLLDTVQVGEVGQTVLRCHRIENADRRRLDLVVLCLLQTLIDLPGDFRRRKRRNNVARRVCSDDMTYRRERFSVSVGTCPGCGETLHGYQVLRSRLRGRGRLSEGCPPARPEI